MLDLSWGELVLIGMVALIVIGPKELPTVLRTMGQWLSRIRRMASEFQGQFQDAMREAEFSDLKKQVDSIGDPTHFTGDNPPAPLRDEPAPLRDEIDSAFDDAAEKRLKGEKGSPAGTTASATTTSGTTSSATTASGTTAPTTGAATTTSAPASARPPIPEADPALASADAPPAPEGGAPPASPERSSGGPSSPTEVGGGRAA